MNNSGDPQDQRFIIGISAFATLCILSTYKSKVLSMYDQNKFLIIFLLFSVLTLFLVWFLTKSIRKMKMRNFERAITQASPSEDAIFAGFEIDGEAVYIKQSYRRMHTQIVGTTNAGKTESVIVPWAVDDMKRGRGLVIIDGKSDRVLLDKLYSYAKIYGRQEDFRILSLCDVQTSHTFNPFNDGSPLEVTERVFKALNFENEYFKNLQYEAFLQTLIIFEENEIIATPAKVIEFLRSPARIKSLGLNSSSREQNNWASDFLMLNREEREQRTSGLLTQLQSFATGNTAQIFNADRSDINFESVLKDNLIVYCQLPVLKIPTLGKATGKFILQALQSAIASRHLSSSKKMNHFTIYLDDFTEYLTEGFVSLLNKSRSANAYLAFAHQAVGDLAILGDDIKNSILTNANLKIFMRTNEPDSAEYFSKVVGTSETEKVTERQKREILGNAKTGDTSVRSVEEYKFHPNLFKQGLGVGEAVVIIPHERGSKALRMKFRMLPDVPAIEIPEVAKSATLTLDESILRFESNSVDDEFAGTFQGLAPKKNVSPTKEAS